MPSTLSAKSTTYSVDTVKHKVGVVKHVGVRETSTKGIEKRLLYSVKGDKVVWSVDIKGEEVYSGSLSKAVKAYNKDYV